MKNFSGIVGGLVLVAGAGAWALQFGTAGAVKKRAAVVAGERNEQLMDPWNAPLGAPVEGAVLSDGWRDLREVPGPVNVDGGWTDSVMVTRNGRRLFYGYTRYDFWQFYFSLSTPTPAGVQYIPSGPQRPGMTGDAFKIFQADLGPRGWVETFHAVNGDPTLSEASAAVNLTEDLLVFNRFPTGLPRGIFFSSRTADGWSVPAAVPGINSGCDDDNGFVVGDLLHGATFYFESSRVDTAASSCGSLHRICRTYFPPAGVNTPIQFLPGLGTANDDTQISVSPDQKEIYWTSVRAGKYGVFTADLQPNGTYGNIRPVVTGVTTPPFQGKVTLMGEANVARVPQGELMYLMCGIAGGDSGGHPVNIRLKICQARRTR
ncbi:MAG: hypothetical protein IPP68_05355 [Elusimicrobia bacterium]|nr:hypothetical protein [Elusimicrobiota bacterium]